MLIFTLVVKRCCRRIRTIDIFLNKHYNKRNRGAGYFRLRESESTLCTRGIGGQKSAAVPDPDNAGVGKYFKVISSAFANPQGAFFAPSTKQRRSL